MYFEKNDIVICVDNAGQPSLVKGHRYKVSQVPCSDSVKVVGLTLSFYASRFVKDTTSPFVQWEKDAGVNETCST